MKIACTVGHSILKTGEITSADGTRHGGVNEYKWCKKFVPILTDEFRKQGHIADIIQCPEKVFAKPYEEKNYKLSRINKKGYDLVIESHLNAFNSKAKGTETLYTSERGRVIAQRVNDKLDDIFVDRGIKKRNDLYILTQTDCAAILNEYFFCDNKEEYLKADEEHEMRLIAKKVVEGVLNITIQDKPIEKPQEVFDMDKIVLYFGDADLFSATIVSQKNQCPLMKKSDFDKSGLKVKEIIQIGGKPEDTDRFVTMKNACKYL